MRKFINSLHPVEVYCLHFINLLLFACILTDFVWDVSLPVEDQVYAMSACSLLSIFPTLTRVYMSRLEKSNA